MQAFLLELAGHLRGPCSDQLEANSAGQVACRVLEATPESSGCAAQGREPVPASSSKEILELLAEAGHCGTAATGECEVFQICEVAQLQGDAREAGLTNPNPDVAGSFYIDDASEGSSPFTSHCLEVARDRLRLVGAVHPGARVFYSCEPA